jgi:hypothetical protein
MFSSNAGLNQHARTVHTAATVTAVRPPPSQTNQPRECCISTPGHFSHSILDLSFAASRTAGKVHRCGDCLRTFSSKGERKRHARTVQKVAAVGSPGTQTTQPCECYISTPERFSHRVLNFPSPPLNSRETAPLWQNMRDHQAHRRIPYAMRRLRQTCP